MKYCERALPLCLSICLLLAGCTAPGPARPGHLPIIDMHLHAFRVEDFGVGLGAAPAFCSDNRDKYFYGWDPATPFAPGKQAHCAGTRIAAPGSDAELMRRTLAALGRDNIRAVTSGDAGALDEVAKWRAAAPDRIIPAVDFQTPERDAHGGPTFRPIAQLRRLVAEGKVAVFAEVAPQYDGMSPADARLDPYFALAEELDVPVGIHMGEGPPGGPNVQGYAEYRVRLGDPLLLEDVLARHPKLRLYVMHFGSPFVDNMIALLYSYPQVYVDIAQNDWGFPRKQFHSQLRRLVDAGFGKRIMFGSDQMIWPETIDLAIDTVDAADFLSAEQKRDIFHDNAARFLRLDAEPGAGR